MTKDEETRAITALIAEAESDSHTWQVAENAERYMEACDRTEALELQLGQRMQQGSLAQTRPLASKPRGKLLELGRLTEATFTAIGGERVLIAMHWIDRNDSANGSGYRS